MGPSADKATGNLWAPAQGVEAAVQQVVFEATATEVRVKNAISNLSLLMNTRFIENVSAEQE